MLPTISKRPFSSSHLALRNATFSVRVCILPGWSVTLVPKPLGHLEGSWNAPREESHNLYPYLADGNSGDGRIQCIDRPTLVNLCRLAMSKIVSAICGTSYTNQYTHRLSSIIIINSYILRVMSRQSDTNYLTT